MAELLPVTVVIPTIGRARQLAACLESLAATAPRASEILVVDQSQDPDVAEVIERHAHLGARRVGCRGPGKAIGTNAGLRNAAHEAVMMTDDDCTVAPTWVGVGWRLMTSDPTAVFTGRVLPAGDPDGIPSIVDEEAPRDYTGKADPGALYWGNMACNRSEVLSIGGFEEKMRGSAADNDFCYRWLRDGRVLRFDPQLVVWHHDWRTPGDLDRVYVNYARGQGMFYAKHLRTGDPRMLRFIARDVYLAVRGRAARVVRGRTARRDWTDGVLRGLPLGLLEGWRAFKRT